MKKTGFTLIELSAALCILGILIAIAYPSYQQFIIKTRRTEGQAALLNAAIAMESHYAKHHSYENANIPVNGRWYVVDISEQSENTFTIKATPRSAQAHDAQCQTLTLNSLNVKGISSGPKGTPTGKSGDCW